MFEHKTEIIILQLSPWVQVTFPAQTTIDGDKIDQLLSMLHDADPTNGDADPPSLPRLEDQVGAMGPLIDQELERVDRLGTKTKHKFQPCF